MKNALIIFWIWFRVYFEFDYGFNISNRNISNQNQQITFRIMYNRFHDS